MLIDDSICFYLEKFKSKLELEGLKLKSEMINNMY